MKDTSTAILGIAISILPFYAAIEDFMNDQLFWALLDIGTIFIGIIRGAMYFLGYL